MPSQSRRRSRILAAILISTLAPQAGSFASAAGSPASAPARPARLTPELMQKMRQLLAAKGQDGELLARFANASGLTATGQPWLKRTIYADNGSNPATTKHGFAIGRGADQGAVLDKTSPGSDIHYAYHVEPDGALLGALAYNRKTGEITMRNSAEAQTDLEVEFAFWAANVEPLLAAK
jgi:hypothetical protein